MKIKLSEISPKIFSEFASPIKILKSVLLISGIVFSAVACSPEKTSDHSNQKDYTGNEVKELKEQIASGWNTWNTRSVLSHVLLPEAFAINLKLKEGKSGDILEEALIGRSGYGSRELVIPGPHTYDGSYTELELKWRDIHIQVQTASEENDLHILVTPVKVEKEDSLIIDPVMLWNKEGDISIEGNTISTQTPSDNIKLILNRDQYKAYTDKLHIPLDKMVSVSSNSSHSAEEIQQIISEAKEAAEASKAEYKEVQELYNAMQTVLAWDLIYEPTHDRVIAPVSRTWNVGWEGWILFDWDTYFAAYMFALDNKELAYANAIAITNEITEDGFIPNFGSARGTSEDRSQPPVGSFVVKEIYRKYQEKWFLNEVFDELLSWNRWWTDNRDVDGYLVWGSDPYDAGEWPEWLIRGIGTKKGAKWESGLDNSPMYDDAVFDSAQHLLMQADVGLMSFYIMDCLSLSEIASVLGKKDIEQELMDRAEMYSKKLQTLWNDEFGLYLNKDLTTGEFSYRLSPTLFYPLLAEVPDQKQAERMINEHFYNPEEFWGEYILPSIARNDPAFPDNDYWRGRIWAPMNFLVYLGLKNYDLPDAREDLVNKSKNLLLKSWLGENHIYENYNSETGVGSDARSDKFYHWGALLGFIGIMEEGYMPSPDVPLKE